MNTPKKPTPKGRFHGCQSNLDHLARVKETRARRAKVGRNRPVRYSILTED